MRTRMREVVLACGLAMGLAGVAQPVPGGRYQEYLAAGRGALSGARYPEAEEHLVRAVNEGSFGIQPVAVQLEVLRYLGECYRQQGKFADAVHVFEWMLKQHEAQPGHALGLPEAVDGLVAVFHAQGLPEREEETFAKGVALARKAPGAGNADLCALLTAHAAFRIAKGKSAEAGPLLLEALRVTEDALGADDRRTMVAHLTLAEYNRMQGHLSSARQLYTRAVAQYTAQRGAVVFPLFEAITALTHGGDDKSRAQVAVTHYTDAVAMLNVWFGEEDTRMPWREERSYLVWVSMRSGREEIWGLNGDGTGARQLTRTSAGYHYMPAISRDGRKIAYVADHRGMEIWVADRDGRNARQVTREARRKFAPAFTADGSALLYYIQQQDKWDIRRIYRINLDGSDNRPLTAGDVDDLNPVMSPDGKTIYFESNRDKNSELYRMNADGSNQTRLTDSPEFDGDIDVSPDGKWLAFASTREDGISQIYLMNLSTCHVRRLTYEIIPAAQPTFSPDGRQIAYHVGGSYHNDICRINIDGSGRTLLTRNRQSQTRGGPPRCDWFPTWSVAPWEE